MELGQCHMDRRQERTLRIQNPGKVPFNFATAALLASEQCCVEIAPSSGVVPPGGHVMLTLKAGHICSACLYITVKATPSISRHSCSL